MSVYIRVWIDIKGKMNRNESYREKNRGLIYMSRFVTLRKKIIITIQQRLI